MLFSFFSSCFYLTYTVYQKKTGTTSSVLIGKQVLHAGNPPAGAGKMPGDSEAEDNAREGFGGKNTLFLERTGEHAYNKDTEKRTEMV